MPSSESRSVSYDDVSGSEAAVSPIRRWSFRVAVILVTVFLIVGLAPALKGLFLNWLPRDLFLAARPDIAPGDEVHRLHSTVVALLFWCLIIGLGAQLWHPADRVALLAMSFAVLLAEAVGELLSGTYTLAGTGVPLAIVGIVAVLHPSKLRASWITHWHQPSMLLALLAAGPLGTLAAVASEEQRASARGSIDYGSGHLTFVAAFGILVVLLAGLGASSIPGQRVVAWIAGLLMSAFVLQCLLFPSSLSTVPVHWALVGLVWSASLVFLAERRAMGAADSSEVR